MDRYNELRKKLNNATQKTQAGTQTINSVNMEMHRVSTVAKNAEQIISNIDEQFAKATKLNKTDIIFLFFATALQCVRWIALPAMDFESQKPSIEERKTSQQGAIEEEKAKKSFMEEHEDWEI